jgi:hypothetical protein
MDLASLLVLVDRGIQIFAGLGLTCIDESPRPR